VCLINIRNLTLACTSTQDKTRGDKYDRLGLPVLPSCSYNKAA
jgi:hypothetical protein